MTPPGARPRVGIDVGGTFTDVVALDAVNPRTGGAHESSNNARCARGVAAGIVAGIERCCAIRKSHRRRHRVHRALHDAGHERAARRRCCARRRDRAARRDGVACAAADPIRRGASRCVDASTRPWFAVADDERDARRAIDGLIARACRRSRRVKRSASTVRSASRLPSSMRARAASTRPAATTSVRLTDCARARGRPRSTRRSCRRCCAPRALRPEPSSARRFRRR